MIHRFSTVYLRQRYKYLQFSCIEILQVLAAYHFLFKKQKIIVSHKKMRNVSLGTSANRVISLLLIVNMAFADLISGAVCLPLYVYLYIGPIYRLWKSDLTSYKTWRIGFDVVDTTFSEASLISAVCIACERFYAIFRPLKHRTLSFKAYFIVIVIIWTLAMLVCAVCRTAEYLISCKAATYAWMSFPLLCLFIVCLCNIGIYRTFHKRTVSSQQGNRASQTQRLTVTLLLVYTISLLSWLPLVTAKYIFYVQNITTSKWCLIYDIINILNYSNCFVNSVVYSLRIPEFRQALVLSLTRCQKH